MKQKLDVLFQKQCRCKAGRTKLNNIRLSGQDCIASAEVVFVFVFLQVLELRGFHLFICLFILLTKTNLFGKFGSSLFQITAQFQFSDGAFSRSKSILALVFNSLVQNGGLLCILVDYF